VLLQKEFSISGFTGGGEYIVDEVVDSFAYESSSSYFCRVLGQKQYEMSNHLGNVLATVLDRRTGVFDEGTDTLLYYVADVVNATLYYPFGSSMVSFSNTEFYYSFGMNTQEKDDEIYGVGNSYSAEYWQYDARLGRRWNNDPRPNPSISVYACFGNNPTIFNDVMGDSVTLNLTGSNMPALIPIGRNETLTKFINQFGSINEGTTQYRSNGKYGNNIHLNINSEARNSTLGINMIASNQDAQTAFTYSLSDGSTVDVAGYVVSPGINVVGINIDVSVLQLATIQPSESIGNYQTHGAAATSIAVTNELLSTVRNFMDLVESNTAGGAKNYANLTAAFKSAPPAGGVAAPNNAIMQTALNQLENSGLNKDFFLSINLPLVGGGAQTRQFGFSYQIRNSINDPSGGYSIASDNLVTYYGNTLDPTLVNPKAPSSVRMPVNTPDGAGRKPRTDMKY
jgi:hypothetical protein